MSGILSQNVIVDKSLVDAFRGQTPVSATASTLTVTAADHAGRTVLLDRAAGIVCTLPAATGSGDKYRFIVKTTVTSNAYIIKVTTNDTFAGLALGLDGDGVPANAWTCGTTDDTVNMDGSTQGGVIGDIVEVEDIATDLWYCSVRIKQSGTEATPFAATVS